MSPANEANPANETPRPVGRSAEGLRLLLLIVATVALVFSITTSARRVGFYLDDLRACLFRPLPERRAYAYGADYVKAVQHAESLLRKSGGSNIAYQGDRFTMRGKPSRYLTSYLLGPGFNVVDPEYADVRVIEVEDNPKERQVGLLLGPYRVARGPLIRSDDAPTTGTSPAPSAAGQAREGADAP